jgi:TfoX/Sxy family transcriptional regulator of competence genes
MSEWTKTPEETVVLFNESLPVDDRVERRKMFGYPCAFVNNNLFTGTHQADIIVRLPPDRQAAVIAAGGAGFEPMGRRMKEYVTLPTERLGDDAFVAEWIGHAFAYASALPPKVKKPRKKKAKKTT